MLCRSLALFLSLSTYIVLFFFLRYFTVEMEMIKPSVVVIADMRGWTQG